MSKFMYTVRVAETMAEDYKTDIWNQSRISSMWLAEMTTGLQSQFYNLGALFATELTYYNV